MATQALKRGGKRPMATAAEVADYLRKPVGTLTNWRYRGIGPRYFKVGQDVRYDWDDVETWLTSQCRPTDDDRMVG